MENRVYIVKMPEATPTTAFDIVVGFPGAQDDPVTSTNAPGSGWATNNDGAYYETRGRALRLPTVAADGASGGFVPRMRLGFAVIITPIKGAICADIPGVRLSQSLAALATTDSGPTINIPVLTDPSYGPAVRLTGSAATAGLFFVVTLLVMEPRDDDRLP